MALRRLCEFVWKPYVCADAAAYGEFSSGLPVCAKVGDSGEVIRRDSGIPSSGIAGICGDISGEEKTGSPWRVRENSSVRE